MLFNSYIFIFAFMPLTLLLFFKVAKRSKPAALGVLFLASVLFYGWCDYRYALILLFSITTNFFIGRAIVDAINQSRSKMLLWVGVSFNLGLLGYFKYTNFFIQNLNALSHSNLDLLNITLPIGISFFTFTQIAYLVDSYRGLVGRYSFLNYGLFVTYFPHLIAGPIIHHKEVMPQFDKERTYQFNYRNFALGTILFTIGLFKKIIIADSVGVLVSPVFDLSISHVGTLEAWVAALAYTLELYFDFSGYSDMALGVSLMLGVRLPVNFYSPYQATNIIDFWRRWNMTLSRFLRDYLYIALGGNRKGKVRRYLNLILTMLLGGLWHGANWTFVIWGLLHGSYLCINHGWKALRAGLGLQLEHSWVYRNCCRLVTFLAVVVAWVFFRGQTASSALAILHSMFSGPFTLHESQTTIVSMKSLLLISSTLLLVWLMPNSYQLLSRFKPALLDYVDKKDRKIKLHWQPTWVWQFVVAAMMVISIISLQKSSIFLYFRF